MQKFVSAQAAPKRTFFRQSLGALGVGRGVHLATSDC